MSLRRSSRPTADALATLALAMVAAVCTIRRVAHEGQMSRLLHEKVCPTYCTRIAQHVYQAVQTDSWLCHDPCGAWSAPERPAA